MISRKQVEEMLRINGVSSSAKDEEIRTVLVSAKWHEEDIRTAMTVLREETATGIQRVETIHNVFNSDKRLSPEAIESLLGIDVDMTSDQIASIQAGRKTVSLWQIFLITFYAIVLAFGSVLLTMYVKEVGFFHPGF